MHGRREVKQIPPLRGRRSRSRAEEKAGRSGRDDSGSRASRYSGMNRKGNNAAARPYAENRGKKRK